MINEKASVVGFGQRFTSVYDQESTLQEKLYPHQINFVPTSDIYENEIPIRSFDYCKPPPQQPFNQICAGGIMEGSTQGDSGGPLIVMRNFKLVQIGITSFGSYKAVPNDVNRIEDRGIYTKVSAYCDWIEFQTSGEIKCL